MFTFRYLREVKLACANSVCLRLLWTFYGHPALCGHAVADSVKKKREAFMWAYVAFAVCGMQDFMNINHAWSLTDQKLLSGYEPPPLLRELFLQRLL